VKGQDIRRCNGSPQGDIIEGFVKGGDRRRLKLLQEIPDSPLQKSEIAFGSKEKSPLLMRGEVAGGKEKDLQGKRNKQKDSKKKSLMSSVGFCETKGKETERMREEVGEGK